MSEKPSPPEPGASPGLLALAVSGVILGVIVIAAYCLMGNWWLLPVAVFVIAGLTVLMVAAVMHLIDTGTVVPSVSASREQEPAPQPARQAAPRAVLHH